jgi:hypothetical protein
MCIYTLIIALCALISSIEESRMFRKIFAWLI